MTVRCEKTCFWMRAKSLAHLLAEEEVAVTMQSHFGEIDTVDHPVLPPRRKDRTSARSLNHAKRLPSVSATQNVSTNEGLRSGVSLANGKYDMLCR